LPGRDEELALRLVDHVHYTLGQYRPDDPRTGWEESARRWPQVPVHVSRSCGWDPGAAPARANSREHSAVSWPVLFLSLRCWMGYRAVVEWVKDSPGRAMGVVPGTLHVRVAVGSQPDALGPESSGPRPGHHGREDPNLPSTTAAGEGDEAHPRHIERAKARKMSMAGRLDQSDHGGIRCR
jgi:hypothetical protein